VTRFAGQIMDGGATRKRLQIPPIEYPIIWVDMTSSHWSVLGKKPSKKGRKESE
jgi:hypothetical protein